MRTRAVNRVDNDYPRIVAIDEPLVRPLSGMKDIKKFSQHYVDLLNLEENRIESMPLPELTKKDLNTKLDLIGARDMEAENCLKALGKSPVDIWVLTFDNFLTTTSFTPVMARMLKTLENKYKNPVDIEFTVNFNQKDEIRINLLQCRPLQTTGYTKTVEMQD